MPKRLIIYLTPSERQLLNQLALADYRPPDAQIRYLIVTEAQKRGILSATDNTVPVQPQHEAALA